MPMTTSAGTVDGEGDVVERGVEGGVVEGGVVEEGGAVGGGVDSGIVVNGISPGL